MNAKMNVFPQRGKCIFLPGLFLFMLPWNDQRYNLEMHIKSIDVSLTCIIERVENVKEHYHIKFIVISINIKAGFSQPFKTSTVSYYCLMQIRHFFLMGKFLKNKNETLF